MNTWLGFGISSTITKTYMHFLPAASGIGAPYPVDLKVTVGGSSLPRRTLSVDGARLGHPDGFRLEDAVPALTQQVSGFYLLQVDLAPTQQRIDLSASNIVIEIQYQQAAARYFPRRIRTQLEPNLKSRQSEVSIGSIMSRGIFNPDAEISTGFAIRDPALYASLVLLNSSSRPVLARIFSSRTSESVGSLQLASDSVKEFELSEIGLTRSTKLDSTWGSLEAEAFRVVFENIDSSAFGAESLDSTSNAQQGAELTLGAAAAAYVVYRDRNSRRISSVIAL